MTTWHCRSVSPCRPGLPFTVGNLAPLTLVLAAFHDGADELSRIYLQGISDPKQNRQGWLCLCNFHPGNEGTMDVGPVGQFLLADLDVTAACLDLGGGRPQYLFVFCSAHPQKC